MAVTIAAGPEQVPMLVTASLRSGVSMDLPYGLDLAGLLAARLRTVDRSGLDVAGLRTSAPLPDTTEQDPEDMDLPLAVCSTGADWHWLASCALPLDAGEHPEPRTFYRTVDAAWAQRAAERPVVYHHPSKGPYRDMMMPSPVVVTHELQWQAVGDPDRVEGLLRGLRFIGRRRAVGEGGVTRWRVETVDADPGSWGHLRGADLIRPCPPECAEELSVDYRLGWYAVRPPSWHPDRLAAMAMTPEAEEDW